MLFTFYIGICTISFFIALYLSKVDLKEQGETFFKKQSLPNINTLKERKELRLVSTFSTYILSKNFNRLNNILVALKSLDGLKVFPSKQYSFNEITGERNEKNGYKEAKVIKDGDYVEGFGGGVCQVSTTLYNALLLADIDILEVHSHTLKPSYVKCSFDAMVNFGTSDLRFINKSDDILFIKAFVRGSNIVIEVYGENKEYDILPVSLVKEEIPFTYEIEFDKENKYKEFLKGENDEYILKEGQNGLITEGYLNYYKDGKLIKQKKIRTDIYSAKKGVKIKYFLKT